MAEKTVPQCKFQTDSKQESIWQKWRHIAAYVFLSICLFDYVAMPIVIESANVKIDKKEAVKLSMEYTDPANRATVFSSLNQNRSWDPLTSKQNGAFFYAFMAILGAASWTRGHEKIEKAKKEGSN